MKTVLITGGSRGLGASLVSTFSKNGYRVIATTRNAQRHDNLKNVSYYHLDLNDLHSVDNFALLIKSSGIEIDILINNAGYNPKDTSNKEFFHSTFKIENFDPEAIIGTLRVNSLMPLALASRLLPSLAERGAIVNISSWLGSITNKSTPGHYAYAGSKALLNMFTKALAFEPVMRTRTCVAINPGWMRTQMGGDNANQDPSEVAHRILELYETNNLSKNSGNFLNIDGSVHPW